MLQYIDPGQALDLVLASSPELPSVNLALRDATGLVLTRAVTADRDNPPFDKAMMDGFAVRTADSGRKVHSLGSVAAGQDPDRFRISDGKCVEIMTGAPVPEGTEAVVPVEKTERFGDLIQLPDDIKEGANIAQKGCDAKRGQTIIRPGAVLTALRTAVLASLGYEIVQVIPKPVAGIIITGDEVVTSGKPGKSSIRDANGPMLQALVNQAGIDEVQIKHAGDSKGTIVETLESMSACDLIILSGGVSMGEKDFVPAALRQFGAELIFHKVAQRPGKPMLFGRKNSLNLFGLPGNPLSCYLCFHRYIARSIRKMSGMDSRGMVRSGILETSLLNRGKRTVFHQARVTAGIDNRYHIALVSGSGSADIFRTESANAYIRLDPGESRSAGDAIQFEWFGENRWLD